MKMPPRRDAVGAAAWWRALVTAGVLAVPATGAAQRVASHSVSPDAIATTANVTPATRSYSLRHTMEHAMDQTGRAGEVIRGRYEGSEGARPWRLFVPSRRTAKPGMLLVVLHGCLQNANDIAAGTRMDEVAEEQGFSVLYPEQVPEANARGCWNWFDAAHQSRGSGEPAIIAAMLADLVKRPELANVVDRAQIHLVGISAGAAMANLVAVAYPETFASLTSASGITWKGASDVTGALTVMQKGGGGSVQTADAVVQAMGPNARALPTLVVHGGRDAVVSTRNADETAQQWVGVHDLLRARRKLAPLSADATARTRTENEYTVSQRDWRDEHGGVQLSLVRIEELGHAWSGGSKTGTFTDEKGPDATRMVAAFCASHPMRNAR